MTEIHPDICCMNQWRVFSEESRLANYCWQTSRKNRAIKLDIDIGAADVGDGFELREWVDEILGFVAGGSHIQG